VKFDTKTIVTSVVVVGVIVGLYYFIKSEAAGVAGSATGTLGAGNTVDDSDTGLWGQIDDLFGGA
jgi:hypothetical protein